MLRFLKGFGLLSAVVLGAAAVPVQAAGDLLVAPTRVVLDGSRGTEVVLNNIGAEPATYRISLEIKRMTALGGLDEIDEADANDAEKAALDMISFSPRRVTLPPNQPQVIRVGVRVPEGTPPGEYRAHMLFRAVPDAAPAADPAKPATTGGVSIALTPIYGITIPVIVRVGDLGAEARIGEARVVDTADGLGLCLRPVAQRQSLGLWRYRSDAAGGRRTLAARARHRGLSRGRPAPGPAPRARRPRGEAERSGAHPLYRGPRGRRRHDRRGRSGGAMS
ncbi:hypothetical protein [Sphingopyxis sp. PET50]|uniref:hypothetical protein n=1 Tax=Sphingopyxis sp. PET50 TaxID=2976533 RepID=UPI0021B00983|nr:hypothetical protein [Sphingopyxis sp. PET50]